MRELKKNGKVFTSKSVGTGPSSYEKKHLPGCGLTKVEKHCSKHSPARDLTCCCLPTTRLSCADTTRNAREGHRPFAELSALESIASVCLEIGFIHFLFKHVAYLLTKTFIQIFSLIL